MENFVFKEKVCYKRRIIEMVEEISDDWILKQIFRFIKNMKKEGD